MIDNATEIHLIRPPILGKNFSFKKAARIVIRMGSHWYINFGGETTLK